MPTPTPEDQQRLRPTRPARRSRLLGLERLESRTMLAAAADGGEAEANVDGSSDFARDYDQWFAVFCGSEDTSPPEPAVVSDEGFVAQNQTFVSDNTYGSDDTTVEGPAVVQDDAGAEDAVASGDCIVATSSVGGESTWFDDHGCNAIQPQVITPSRHLPWIESPATARPPHG